MISLTSRQPENNIASTSKLLVSLHEPPRIRRLTHRVINPTSADPISLINKIRERGMRAAVAISPDTPSSAITDEVGNLADMLLVMTVYSGRKNSFILAQLLTFCFSGLHRQRWAKVHRTVRPEGCRVTRPIPGEGHRSGRWTEQENHSRVCCSR